MLYVARKRGFPRKFARFVLFRPIKKHSFNLFCVLTKASVYLLYRYLTAFWPMCMPSRQTPSRCRTSQRVQAAAPLGVTMAAHSALTSGRTALSLRVFCGISVSLLSGICRFLKKRKSCFPTYILQKLTASVHKGEKVNVSL